MRAVYKSKEKIGFEKDILSALENNELLIKVTACGVCGTDLHIYKDEVSFASPPVVLGHEITGIIEDKGRDVKDIPNGTPVAVDPVIPCYSCYYCRLGKPNLCRNQTIIGYQLDGGFASYVKVPRSQVYPISETIGKKGGILIEPVACIINGYNKLDIKPGSTVFIMGAGPIGLLWAQMFKYSPVKFIVQSDLIDERCKKAINLGADYVINASDTDACDYLKDKFQDDFDIVIDATGDSKAVEEGIKLTANLGTMMIFGVCPENSSVSINPLQLYNKEMKIIASKMPPQSFEYAVRLIESGKIEYSSIVSHTFSLKRLPEALEKFENSKDEVLKMMIDPWL